MRRTSCELNRDCCIYTAVFVTLTRILPHFFVRNRQSDVQSDVAQLGIAGGKVK